MGLLDERLKMSFMFDRKSLPSKRISLLLHWFFLSTYTLLLVRAAMAVYAGEADMLAANPDSSLTHLLKRICGILYGPFYALLSYPNIGGVLVTSIGFALFGYALLHYGIFMEVPVERSNSMANRILDFCRMIFFLAGTLLILLIVIRMSVMLYRDVTFPRMMMGVPARK
jgi:hypothetical protein